MTENEVEEDEMSVDEEEIKCYNCGETVLTLVTRVGKDWSAECPECGIDIAGEDE